MKKTITGFIIYKTDSWVDDDKRIGFDTFDPRRLTDSRSVVIREHSIEVDVPDNFDPRPQQIKKLEEKQQEAAAAFHALTIEIKRKISELQSLENKPSDDGIPF
ncbi:MAG: hypothetical protein V4772_08880 [Pseudomonadota bacterium]